MASRPLDEECVFNFARKLPDDGARAEYLDQVCHDNPTLRARVEVLLRADRREDLLESPTAALAVTVDPFVIERPGVTIGPYKLREQIGEGGMGVVFVAEQEQPVRRKVALKIIKPGMDTAEVIARFEAERQALALMDHPNIAKVFDAGTTDTGRPYFIMELIRGVPITEFCDRQGLNTRERLDLFVTVCRAVQHAHAKGVIHRDLKPSNILVSPHDALPIVKIIDFGIAKAIGQQLTDKTIYTQLSQMIGTPLYMSPEQAQINALDVDTRSDIYSLGILLYELITGTTPFDRTRFSLAAQEEIRRIIREEDPPMPSRRLSSLGEALKTISTQRNTDPNRLVHAVKGELDWITMRCLEKDRSRRYQTALELAADLGRYLHNEPVTAVPPSRVYRAKKLIGRYRAWCAILVSLCAVSVVFVSFLAYGWAKYRAIALSLQSELLDKAFNEALNGELDSALDAIRRAGDVGVSRQVTGTLEGISFATAGKMDEAVAKLRALAVDQSDSVASAALVWVYYEHGEIARAEQLFEVLRNRQDQPTEMSELDIGKVFVARLSTYAPNDAHQTAIEKLSDIIGRHRLWGIAYFARGEAYRDKFVHTRQMTDLQLAMNDQQVARVLLPHSEVVKTRLLSLHLNAYEFAVAWPDKVDDARREAWRTSADDLASELSMNLSSWDGAATALAYYRATKQNATADDLESRIEVRFADLQPIRDMNWFVSRNYSQFQAAVAEGASVFTKHIFALALFEKGDLQAARTLIDETLTESMKSADAIASAIEVLQLMGDFARAEELAKAYLSSQDSWEFWDWSTQAVKYHAGEVTEEQLLRSAHPFHEELCVARYNVGLWHLARGDQDVAKKQFEGVIETGRIGWGCYARAKAFLKRLEQNPRWPNGWMMQRDLESAHQTWLKESKTDQ